MGGSQSTQERKLTVENENAIQVSQEVLNRIQDQLSTQTTATQVPSQTSIPPPAQYVPQPFYNIGDRKEGNVAEEAYWAQRIENLKRAHEHISASMDIEYQKTLKEANELFEKVKNDTVVSKLPPCQDEKAKVLECYSTNPNKTLLCSVLVNQFNDCVCRSRISSITAS